MKQYSIVILAGFMTILMLVSFGSYKLGVKHNESTHVQMQNDKLLQDAKIEADVSDMSLDERDGYIGRMFKPMEEDNHSRFVRPNCIEPPRRSDTFYPDSINSRRFEEEEMPFTQKEKDTIEGILNGR